MRVLFFTAFGTPHKGGVERYSLALARRLTTHGHQVTIVTCNTERAAPHEAIDQVEVIRLPAWVLAGGQFPVPIPGRRAIGLLRQLRANRPDVVSTHTRFYVTSLLGFVVARWLRTPLLHVEHGSRTYEGPSRIVNAFGWLVDKTWGRMIIRRADRVVAVSADVRRFTQELGSPDVDVLAPSIDVSAFRPDDALRTEWRRRLGVAEGQVVLAFCGRLVRTKGVLDLAEAFEGLDSVGALLVYAGEGPDRSRLMERERVRCLGELDDSGVIGVLNAADIFVNPSYSEGLPSTVLEAGAVGLPIVATDVGGTREIISSPDEGILVTPGDVPGLRSALQTLVSDAVARKQMGDAVRDRVLDRFVWRDDAVTTFLNPH